MAHSSTKSILYALGANLGVAIMKTIAAIITGSGSMIAEAIHSFADCGNQGLLFLGIKRSKHEATPDHPLGYGKAIYFWSFIVALILFSMGGLFSIYEGIHKLNVTTPLESPIIAIIVLSVSILLEGISLRGCTKEINKIRGDHTLWQWFRSTRRSELIVVFGEDFAAIIGLSFALCAITVAMITGNPVFDAIGSIGIGVLLVIVSVFVGIEVKGMLIGQSVNPEKRAAIQKALNRYPAIKEVFNVITLQLGDDVMVAAKVRFNEDLSAIEMIKELNRCEVKMKEMFPEIRFSFMEPDIRD